MIDIMSINYYVTSPMLLTLQDIYKQKEERVSSYVNLVQVPVQ